jgi:D-alanyl-D-alanine carboxypeptidase/D-alanyl-D-alanine-endopeptidase (penicillin-binding protein 4)
MMKKLLLYTVFLIFGGEISSAQNNNTAAKAISVFTDDSELSHAGISICIMDAGTGQLIASLNPDLSLIPASSMKVVTTGAALGILGPDYVFRTELQYDGRIDREEATLHGNLYIKGYGDPTLGSDHLPGVLGLKAVMDTFSKELLKQKIGYISGRVVGDGNYFSSEQAIGANWQWDDIGNSYGAGAHGLNINENQYALSIRQNSIVGSVPEISAVEPGLADTEIINKLSTGYPESEMETAIYAAPYSDEVVVSGNVPAGTGTLKIRGSIPDPPFLTAYHLQETLKSKYNVYCRKKPLNFSDLKPGLGGERSTFFTFYSPNLLTIAEEANKESNNMFVEAMLRAIARFQNADGSPEKGCEMVTAYWKDKGVDMKGFFMEDGSGLSSRSAVTTRQMATILQKLHQDQAVGPAFYNTLPKAGESGTLRSMFKNSAAVGKLRAKSGSMTRVRSYSGYIDRPNGARWCFSVIVNNYTCTSNEMKARLEKFMTRLCE